MTDESATMVRAAEVILPCADLDRTLAFFCDRLGFRLHAIFPADAPRSAVVIGFGLRIRLDCAASGAPGAIRLMCSDPARVGAGALSLTAPNGTRIELCPADPAPILPPIVPQLVISRLDSGPTWGTGRVGMRYRDLVPDRQGGRFIASHIQIPDGGDVADYVHYHNVHFQMIFCYKGWVEVVYEGQGPPFSLHPGDCVLQPPHMRHRVLSCSPGLEVIEISAPAEHETFADPEFSLPNPDTQGRLYRGQRFVRHVASSAPWTPWRTPGFECQDFGLDKATGGIASGQVIRLFRGRERSGQPSVLGFQRHDAAFRFLFILAGAITLNRPDCAPERLSAGDALVVPAGMPHAIDPHSPDLALLEVAFPATFRLF